MQAARKRIDRKARRTILKFTTPFQSDPRGWRGTPSAATGPGNRQEASGTPPAQAGEPHRRHQGRPLRPATAQACLRLAMDSGELAAWPRGVLVYDPVAVRVRERLAVPVPVRVERRHRLVAVLDEPIDGPLPLGPVRQVEHEEVVFGRRLTDAVARLAGDSRPPRGPASRRRSCRGP